uniref:Uncharacterized protein n=1 Tax=Rhodosorus marinus TaxID=101924 RepID=A0A7S2ZGQ4_9RHOD|mmetsp:Transcript_19079/g.76546  ORF Transcript_19079/g.76546 Transcript_19079/m.76546 type:complete len:122 (+) Transcript_19079:169-534(+)
MADDIVVNETTSNRFFRAHLSSDLRPFGNCFNICVFSSTHLLESADQRRRIDLGMDDPHHADRYGMDGDLGDESRSLSRTLVSSDPRIFLNGFEISLFSRAIVLENDIQLFLLNHQEASRC